MRDVIEESSEYEIPPAQLHAAMVSLADALCAMPVAAQHLSWNGEQLDLTQCRAIWEHAQAGRVDYYVCDVEPVEIYIMPLKSLFEWRCKNLPAAISEDDTTEKDEISLLTKNIPPFSKISGKWVNNKKAAEIEGVETRTLADYRVQGIKNVAGNLGRDKDGRVWRREGTPNSHPWYLRSTLLSKSQ